MEKVTCWASEEIPKIKIVEKGVACLSISELLSIIIGGGTKDASTLHLAKNLLEENDYSLVKIYNLENTEIAKFKGIGLSTANRILAALELGRRSIQERKIGDIITTAPKVYNLMHPIIGDLDTEEFWILLLDSNYRLINKKRMFVGGISEVNVDIRLVLKEAILRNAVMIIAVHNHPSGSITASSADNQLTNNLNNACRTLQLRFQDHVIIGDGAYYSYREQRKL